MAGANKFSGKVSVKGGTDNTTIGNVGDSLKVSASFPLTTNAPLPFELAVPAGLVAGYTYLHKFGHNDSLGANPEDIWHVGGLYVWATGAEKINVVSDNTADTSAGTGARTVEIYGLDSNWDEISETITMNGTADVLSTNSYLRLNVMIVRSAGSIEANVGVITATQETSGISMVSIIEGDNQSALAAWSVPAGKTFYLTDWFYGLKSGKNTVLNLKVRPLGEVFQIKRTMDTSESGEQSWTPYFPIAEKSDIIINGEASTGQHAISAGFNGYVVDN